ncbi:uncharacterized protein (UPF0332 family) [Geomicrobium halophilum]|uniref:Uncharacterized protein (UPF0332 family) n=1 Tax=Geomicrobium halophilum TaxID=549000 RepID=A0A841PYC4_9BACL|nr:hypothetical protein [Geomicrobium halophilum]MBB6449145.1 uncharacterized protein (UPF0332 family) [Geomicrobium halophilum]
MYAQICFKEDSHTYAQVQRIQKAVQHIGTQLDKASGKMSNDDYERARGAVRDAHFHSHQALFFEIGNTIMHPQKLS